MKVVALVWSPHEARTASFAEWLDAKLYNIHYFQLYQRKIAPIKYVLQWIKTWFVLFRDRPDCIYITDSPPVAGLCVFVFCRLTGTRFVMDTHSPALFGKKWGWTLPMQRYISRFAELNVIDQERWRKLFESWGSKAIVLENPPKEIAVETLTDLSEPGRPEFVYVGTFNLDEPVDIVLEAAKQFPHCHFYLLGRKNQVKPAWWEMAPANVTFTGYLLQDEYWSRIHSARALIALTTYEYSLVGAGMDGLYANKPVIVSDTETLREFFTEGAVLVPNTAEGLAAGIQQLLDNEEQYKQGIHRLREATETRWKQNFETLRQTIYRKAKPETPPDSQLKAAGSPQ